MTRALLPLYLWLPGCTFEVPVEGPLPLEVSARVVPYPVYGATGAEVREFIDTKAPVPHPERTGGLHVDAYTNWRLAWSAAYVESGGQCYISAPTVSLTVVEVVPAWTPPEGTPAALVARWEAYDRAIRGHEARHKDIAVEAGEAVLAAVSAVPPQASCRDAREVFNAAALAVQVEYDRKQDAFDEETNHGANQGVAFP